ncbi:MBL fold metallo-hydrolase [Treponema sp.]|uniref:MBL fold metallo-hydrolase n=1 Tax=Treponema sp. TaxID=166 RepID=UPI003F10EAB0
MKMILTGTGTSHGIPVIGCDCRVCRSEDSRDMRLRCSAYIEMPAGILVDVGPEFRIQALKYKIRNVSAVFITHSHADHLHGIDDLRVFSHTKALDPANPGNTETEGSGLAIYTNTKSEQDIRHRFDYIFTPVTEGGGKPKIRIMSAEGITADQPLCINGVEVVPVMLKHGHLDDMGFLFSERQESGEKHSIAYLTDCSFVPENSIELVRRNAGILDHLVIDGLREKPHSTHFSFEQALEAAEKMNPRNVYLTHITHNMSHVQIQKFVKDILWKFPGLKKSAENGFYVGPAYDGLVLEC